MEWIKVSEKLPEKFESVLVYDGKKIFLAYIHINSWICVCECYEGSSVIDVTHWMPLPEKPKD